MAEEQDVPKIGAGHASAMFRQGLAELRAAMYPESNVAQPAQYGLYGTKTPGEVMQDKQADARDPDEQPSILGERKKQNEQVRDTREPEPTQPERERE
jgi:hypothetical protein